jgi:parallel beta-helix repeat protein
MDVTHADMGYLGFGTGTSSGVAWRGSQHPPDRPDLPGRPATGDVRSSTLHDNWFGAYTYEAAGMHWTGNIFRDNEAYGFDPHDSSDDFVLVRNVAHGNGRHGIIFSRGCDRNLLKDNVSYDNRGHGFMIDDGRSEDTPDERAKRLPSNQNVLVGNHAYANDGSGIEIEGGEGTVVEGNRLERNHVGVRVKDDASALVADNTLQRSRLAGVDVLAGAGKVRIKGNEITGGWAGVALNAQNAAALAGNRFQGSSAPLVIGGQPRREDGALEVIGRLFRWNPLLILWTAILGVPTVLTLRHLVRTSAGGRHRARARWS